MLQSVDYEGQAAPSPKTDKRLPKSRAVGDPAPLALLDLHDGNVTLPAAPTVLRQVPV
ncbi:MAG: hypothetical protein H7Z19_02560, partial [Chitinophagaceae bacterium]|nr:hypothetical protein [Rubrivivax sp.]